MNEILLPVSIAGLIYLPIIGIWGYQTFALKAQLKEVEDRMHNQLNETEARLKERVNRIEDDQKEIYRLIRTVASDLERAIGRVEGKIK